MAENRPSTSRTEAAAPRLASVTPLRPSQEAWPAQPLSELVSDDRMRRNLEANEVPEHITEVVLAADFNELQTIEELRAKLRELMASGELAPDDLLDYQEKILSCARNTTITSSGRLRKTVYFTVEEWDALSSLCASTRRKYTDVIREALRSYLESQRESA